jgi:uncharacterized protein YaiE (UPF0345 family)
VLNRLAPALAVLSLYAIAFAPQAHADRGVGISTGEITVANRLAPGGGYALPAISVSNTGDVATTYALTITYVDGQPQLRPALDWFDFDPDRFALEAGESRQVNVAFSVPANAEPGDYFALVQAKTVSDQPGGTTVGVAAATKLRFSVAASGRLEAQLRSINRWLDDAAPWTYVVPAALVLGFLGYKARHLPFSVRIERR